MMKGVVSYWIFAVLLYTPLFLSGEKRALIIALGDYNPETHWPAISSVNDAVIIQEALIFRGFDTSRITILTNHLSREGILEAIDTYLIKPSQHGDVVYFHFSGHGQQIADFSGDEIDGLDEALVPVDAPMFNRILSEQGEYIPYYGERHLSDDDLGDKLEELRRKLGPQGNVLVVIDACHSGTATRGKVRARGSATPNIPDGYNPFRVRGETDNGFLGIDGKIDNGLSPMVVFSGSGANELNYEYFPDENTGYGSLSYALSKVMIETPADISYRALFELVRKEMAIIAPKQRPQAEGLLDQVIFGGALLGLAIHISPKEWINEKDVIIHAGVLMNVHRGAVVGFFPMDTRLSNEELIITRGEVINAGPVSALVRLDEGIAEEVFHSSWIYMLEPEYGDITVSVKLSVKEEDIPMFASLAEFTPFFRIEEENAQLIISRDYGTDVEHLIIHTSDDQLLYQIPFPGGHDVQTKQEQLSDIADVIHEFARAKYMRGIELPNKGIETDIHIILMEGNVRQGFSDHSSHSLGKDGMAQLQEGSYIRFQIDNNSRRRIYYALIEITPDNRITTLFPVKGTAPEEYMIPPFKSAGTGGVIYQIAPPYGQNILKLVASYHPFSMDIVSASYRGQQENKQESTLSTFLEALFSGNKQLSRSADHFTPNLNEIAIYNFYYSIVPEQ